MYFENLLSRVAAAFLKTRSRALCPPKLVDVRALFRRRTRPSLQTSVRRRFEFARRGFTLLELLVVVAIIGLLSAYVGPRVLSSLNKSEVTVAQAQIEAFVKALDAYRIDTGRYPTSEQGLAALLVMPANEARWRGSYLAREVPNDPWGRPYIYRSPAAGKEVEIISYGKDGAPGGTAEDADIVH